MANPSKIQTSFTGGEISPALFGRVDLAKFNNGATTMRNFFVSYRGGASTRAGLKYVGTCLQDGDGPPPRDIEFQFNINQGYVLEFGDNIVERDVTGAAAASGLVRLELVSTRGLMTDDVMVVSGIVGTTEANGIWTIEVIDDTHVDLIGTTFANAYVSGGTTSTQAGYMRIKSNGAYVVEDEQDITAITQAAPGVFTYDDSDYTLQNGDWIFISGVGGMTNFNGLVWIVYDVTGTDFSVMDLFGNVMDTQTFDAYTSGGSLQRIYTIPAPYQAVDLPFLKFTQSADTMSLCCVNQDTLMEYPPYDLIRNGATDWVFTKVTFGSSIDPPTGAYAVARNSTTLSTYYSYVVTAIDGDTGEESIASNTANVQNNDISVNAGSNTITWEPVSGASNYNVYKAISSYGAPVPAGVSYGYVGTAFGTEFTDTNIIADFTQVPPLHKNPFARGQITSVTITAPGTGIDQSNVGYSITSANGTGFSGTPIVVGGGVVGFMVTNAGENYATGDTITLGKKATGTYTFTGNPANGNTVVFNGVTWTFVTGVAAANQTTIRTTVAETVIQFVRDLNASANASLNVATYGLSALVVSITYDTIGVGGNAYTLAAGTYGGSVSGATLAGGSTSTGATATLNIGPEDGTYPGCVAYFQQRRVYANTLTNPDSYYFSKPGAYTNMDSSIPSTDDDAIIGAPWAQQINGIQSMQPMTNGLIILTGNGAWLLNGGGDNAPITPSSQNAQSQAYNGCHDYIPSLVVNFDILYVQSKGSIIRDLAYNFYTNIFTGTDMTVLSSHLFNYQQMRQWAYAEEPYKLIWMVRGDGTLLCITYLKEQEVYGWSRHDTNGFFAGVCSVTEPPVDAVYTIVKRYVSGQWKYYAERMDNRNWTTAEDCFCVDSGLSTTLTYPEATLTASAAEGTGNVSDTLIINGGSGYTAPIITVESSTGSGAAATANLTGDVITSITITDEGEGYVAGDTTFVITDSTGSGAVIHPIVTNVVTFTSSENIFTADNVGDVIRIGNNNAQIESADTSIVLSGGGKAVITEYISATEVLANVVEPITAVMYDNPDNMPVPAVSGQWSIATPTSTLRGLNHLEGMEVSILADGGVQERQIVTNGMVSLQGEASLITAGLPYSCQLQTLYLSLPEAANVQGKRKNIGSIVVRVESSRGWSVGTNQPDQSCQPDNENIPWSEMIPVKERNASITAGNAIPLATGDFFQNVTSTWSEYAQSAIMTENPLPVNVIALISSFQIGDS